MADDLSDAHSRGSDDSKNEEEEKLFFIWGEWSQNITTPLKMDFTQPSMISKIALGSSFAIILDKDGAIWSWGYNEFGCIGQGVNKKVSKIPEKVHMPESTDEEFCDVVIGENHVLAVTTSNLIYAWGDNSHKQVGVGSKEGKKIWNPMRVPVPATIEIDKVYAALNSSYALSVDGKVLAWGGNADGQLGLSSLVDIEVPKVIENIPRIGDLVISGKQVIALQYLEMQEENSVEEEVPVPDIVPKKPETLGTLKKSEDALSRGTSTIRELDPMASIPYERKQTEVKSVHSQKSARSAFSHRSNRSGRSTASSRMGGRNQPTDRLSKVLKEIIPVVTELNASFKTIDIEIENHASDLKRDVKSKPLRNVIESLQNIRETMKNDYQNKLSLDPYMDDKESVEIKNFLTIIRDSLLDSLVLRSLQTIFLRMKEMKSALDIFSYINIENHIEFDHKILLPESVKKYASMYHCKKVENSIKRFSNELRSLTVGMTSASCSSASFAINSVLELTQLWAGINNVTSELSKLTKSELKYKVFSNIMEGIWKAYEVISKSNLDRIYLDNEFDDKKFKNYEAYIDHILKLSRGLREKGIKEMEKIKNENSQYFSKHMKAVYNILQENIELREMLSECTKNLILKNLSLKGVMEEND